MLVHVVYIHDYSFKNIYYFFFILNRFTQIWIEIIHIFYDCPFWCVLFIYLSHFEVFWIMWVHEMCSVDKSIQSYIYIRIKYVTLHQYNKAAGIFCKLFDCMHGFCMYCSCNKNWSCTSFRKLCYTWLYPPGRELCQHSNLIFLECIEIYENNFW